jgi:hypothetical protein
MPKKLTKKCSQCEKIKDLGLFSKRKDSKDGYRGYCKECETTNKEAYYNKNQTSILKKKKDCYRLKNPIIIKEVLPEGFKRCKECNEIKDVFKFRKKKNGILGRGAICKKCIGIEQKKIPKTEYNKAYRIKNKKRLLQYEEGYRKNNILLLKNKRNKNRGKLRAYSRKYIANRKKNDPYYKLSMTLRTRIINAIKNQYTEKAYSSIELLGCTIQEVRKHLEKQFTEGMSWNTHGVKGWHIDHIIPCASFDLTDPSQQKLCFHYANLQPLWWDENLSKGAKLDYKRRLRV